MSKLKAISIRQPWAAMIINGYKKIENRTWSTNHRGLILIHASKKFDESGFYWLMDNTDFNKLELVLLNSVKIAPRGGIVGIAKLVDVLKPGDGESNQYRDMDQFGWVLEDARPLKFQPCKGKLSLFDCNIEVKFIKAEMDRITG